MRCTIVGNKIVDHSDVVGVSPVGAAPTTSSQLHSSLNTWLQYIAQKQLQAETRNIQVLGFGATYIRDFTVVIIKSSSLNILWHFIKGVNIGEITWLHHLWMVYIYNHFINLSLIYSSIWAVISVLSWLIKSRICFIWNYGVVMSYGNIDLTSKQPGYST